MTDPGRPHDELLDNAAWHALNTVHAEFADVHGAARRYRTSVSVFAAIGDESDESWRDLAELVGPAGEAVLFRAETLEPGPGWTVAGGGPGKQMVLSGSLPDSVETPGLRALTDDDVPQMMDLIALTEPGPFRRRTIELGNYHGVFDGERLMAMAGQRISVPTHTEISAVCTHPDARRRGHAAIVTAHVARCIIAEGRTPMLHIAAANAPAQRVYESIGFTVRCDVAFTMFIAPAA